METKKIKLYVAIPTVGTVVDSQSFSLRKLEEKYKDTVEFVYPEICVRRIFHDYSRNEQVREFLKTDCDVLWFLDSDVVPPTDILDYFTTYFEEWDLAGGVYPVFMSGNGKTEPRVVFTVYNGTNGKGLSPANVPRSGTALVDGIATGCLFIKRHILEKMAEPWFEFKYDPTTRELIEGEDLGFCKKVGALGYKFFVDYSKVCKHYKHVCLLDVNNYAIEYANAQVMAFDVAIRTQVAQLEAYVRKLKAAEKPKSSIISPHDARK